jgi:hypothetical protein
MIDPAQLRSIAEQEWGEPTVEILEACNVRDEALWALGRRLADRMLSPIPGSRLCAEALGTLLALHLLWNHSTLPRRDDGWAERQADPRLRPFVDDNSMWAKTGT